MTIDRRAGSRKSFVVLAVLASVAAYCPTVSATHTVDLARIYGALDEAEAATAARHLQQALEATPSRQTVSWNGPGGRASGTVTPLRTFKIKSGHFCREFVEAVAVGPDLRSKIQVACRDDRGSWQRVKP